MSRVLDAGSGEDPDPRATETVDLNAESDHTFDLSDGWPLGDGELDAVVANHVVEHLDPDHFFAEASRCVRAGGWIEVTVPLGEDARTDPDHTHEWTYGTPSRFPEASSTHWDEGYPLELVSIDVDAWLGGPFSRFSGPFSALSAVWPAWVARRCFAGELTARYRVRP